MMPSKFAKWALITRYCASKAGQAGLTVALILLAPIGFAEILLFAGCSLLGYGLFDVYPPAAFAVPGAILAGVAIFGVK